jgi:hypothetical protein
MQDKLITSSHLSTGLEDLIQKANGPHPSSQGSFHPQGLPIRFPDLRILVRRSRTRVSAIRSSDHRSLHCILRRCPACTRYHRATPRLNLQSPPGSWLRGISRVDQAFRCRRGSQRRTSHLGRRAEMQRPTSVKRHLPLACSMSKESPRPARSRANSDRLRGRVPPIGTLCDDRIGFVLFSFRTCDQRATLKADQEQAGENVAISFGEHDDTCPIMALRNWLAKAKVTEGAVFRGVDRHGRVASTGLHRDSIAAIFKTAAMRAGMNATNIAGHSVRAGMATQAALNGSSERAIARTTRHRSRRVLRRYIRPGEMFRENASASLGL